MCVEDVLLDLTAFAAQKIHRLFDQLIVFVLADLIDTRARAALDLIEQAGPGSIFVNAV